MRPDQRNMICGWFLIGFMAVSAVMCCLALPRAIGAMETPSALDIVKGKWATSFEKNLNENLPVNDFSKNGWGRFEYALFHQGRKGVVVGADGWLFTDEEFSCPPDAAKNFGDNLSYIETAKETLAAKNVKLAVIIVPAKARVFSNHLGGHALPGCRADVYGDAVNYLKSKDIPATDLLPAMRASPSLEYLYLRTDTHWSPAGAALAAQNFRQVMDKNFAGLALPKSGFIIKDGGKKTHDGDLLRYAPGVENIFVEPDHFSQMSAEPTESGDANSLFGDATPQATLVGTSYSANPNWNFAGFLENALQADVLNAADQGLGPFAVMDKYLASDALKNAPPKLVIWEIPERYLLYPHGNSGGK